MVSGSPSPPHPRRNGGQNDSHEKNTALVVSFFLTPRLCVRTPNRQLRKKPNTRDIPELEKDWTPGCHRLPAPVYWRATEETAIMTTAEFFEQLDARIAR